MRGRVVAGIVAGIVAVGMGAVVAIARTGSPEGIRLTSIPEGVPAHNVDHAPVFLVRQGGEITAFSTDVGQQTHGRIPELLDKDVLDALTRLVLVDAVYLNTDWQVPFQRGATAPFHAPGGDVPVPFMNGQGSGRVGDGWKSAVLPYAGNKLALTVVLPDAGNFDKLTGRLAAEGVGMFDAGHPFEINALSLPQFDIASARKLEESLARLGMRSAFTDRADFSAMTRQEQLALSHVLHQANITVDEKGTVAAAATGIVAQTVSAPARFERLVVDRPFLFFVRDLPTGAILFAGQVTDPSRKN